MSTLSISTQDPLEGADQVVDVEEPLVACRACGSPLELSQPDTLRPQNLLGVCTRCGKWHQVLIEELRQV
jgi:Zn finger protein HypA/HybF involved in hydrogenase expression